MYSQSAPFMTQEQEDAFVRIVSELRQAQFHCCDVILCANGAWKMKPLNFGMGYREIHRKMGKERHCRKQSDI